VTAAERSDYSTRIIGLDLSRAATGGELVKDLVITIVGKREE
jgi:hypothetical protein